MPDLNVTPLSQWAMPGDLLRLPRGQVVRVRGLSLVNCLARGSVPNPLVGLVVEVFNGGGNVAGALTDFAKNPGPTFALMKWVAEEVLIEPPLWNGEGAQPDGAITHAHLTDSDYLTLFNYAVTGVASLGTFPEERPGADDGADGEAVQPEAESVSGDQ